MSAFNAKAGSFLTAADVTPLIENHTQHQASAGINGDDRTNSEFFGADNLKQMLAQPGVVGIRVYHARRWENANGTPSAQIGTGVLAPRAVIVGVDANGNDIINAPKLATSAGNMKMLAMGPACPPHCVKDDVA